MKIRSRMHYFMAKAEVKKIDPEAFALLKSSEEIDDVNIYGDELHAVVRDPRQAARRIEATLRSAGIEPERIEEIFPSIEDVFVALSKKN